MIDVVMAIVLALVVATDTDEDYLGGTRGQTGDSSVTVDGAISSTSGDTSMATASGTEDRFIRHDLCLDWIEIHGSIRITNLSFVGSIPDCIQGLGFH
ncbi:hypothetical protein [Demequina litorisediminis]|uniref:Secreted protein n=1 Tax=Demequina litorisediminis TaxID=1849022 RepID=A0ABQ6IHX2_9MICO|nr:hypothetical protein [Demequina litorisediminis]GMA36915.1 hypothetical protein GCM10025876_31190 [Demequina litorisediminis]